MSLSRQWSAGVFASAIFLVLFPLIVIANSDKFEDDLIRVLNHKEVSEVPVIVVLNRVGPMPYSFSGRTTPSQYESYLKRKTLEEQWELREYVNEVTSNPGFVGESGLRQIMFFWTSNAMMARATPERLWELSQRDEVAQIILDRKIQISYRQDPFEREAEYTYGLERIGVPALRQDFPEVKGEGVVVGVLDTGIDAEHPELAGKVAAFRDFIDQREEAYDDNGHGTHVAGTIAGEGVNGTEIGVAPEVQLVIGKMLSGRGSGSLSGILRAMQWITNPDGESDSSLRPDVVNNSWGGSMEGDLSENPFYQAVVNWVELGIFPVFAAGNSGPRRSTVGSPAGLPDAYAVGATDEHDEVTSFSSRGPVEIIDEDGEEYTLTKPDLVAPGDAVFSAYPGGEYRRLSGTSMAAPHLTGAVALLYQIYPDLSVAEMRQLLAETAQTMDEKSNDYGHGLLDVYHAAGMAYGY